MDPQREQLRIRLGRLSRRWSARGLPSRETVAAAAHELEGWKAAAGIGGVWRAPPRMVTATLDDGLGHGLALIERYGRIMGLTVLPLGLLQSPQAILACCREQKPDILGLTVLYPESDDDLASIGAHLPRPCRLIVGGAAFRCDTALAERCGVDYVAADVADFVTYMLNWAPS